MKLRCRPGDLAMVTYDEESCRDNVGRLVRVAGPLAFNRRLEKHCWLIEPVKNDPWSCVSPQGVHYRRLVTLSSRIEHPDAWLLPLDPDTWRLPAHREQPAPASTE